MTRAYMCVQVEPSELDVIASQPLSFEAKPSLSPEGDSTTDDPELVDVHFAHESSGDLPDCLEFGDLEVV